MGGVLGILLTETYTSGIAWMLNHMGPGCLLAGIWFFAGLASVWNSIASSQTSTLAQSWIRIAAAAAVVALLFNGMGLVRIPLRPIPDDAYRYVHEIERAFEGHSTERVLLDAGTWVYRRDKVIMRDRCPSIGERGFTGTGDFSALLSRVAARHYSKILVRGFHAPDFIYDYYLWPKSSGIRQALAAELSGDRPHPRGRSARTSEKLGRRSLLLRRNHDSRTKGWAARALTMHRHLITGGAGFIGSNLADHYLSQGRQVTILDNFSRPGSEMNLAWLKSRHGNLFDIVRADICHPDGQLVEAAANADVVFHLAAQVAVTTSVTDPRHDFEVERAGDVQRPRGRSPRRLPSQVVYSSTNKVYGKLADLGIVERNGRYAYETLAGGVSEDRPLDPYSPYGCSKCCGDQYVLDYRPHLRLEDGGLPPVVIYGPRQFGMEDQGWLAWFSIRALQGKPVTIYGDGKQVRDILYVGDLIAAYDSAVRNIDTTAGKAYNIGGGPENTLSLLELVEALNRTFGRGLGCSFDDWRPGDQPVFISSIAKAKSDFGWEPRVGVQDGLRKLTEWVQANNQLFESKERSAYAISVGD